jgi:uncharacterized protein
MVLSKYEITGNDFVGMVLAAADRLSANVEQVNALNVFPVPDGDTGTNMNLTLTTGAQELKSKSNLHLGKTAEALSKGLLMGARGNSGVILSQLFRGFAKGVAELEKANSQQIAAAFQSGVETAYKAVVKPVEGTILTVAKESAKSVVRASSYTTDVIELLQELIASAKEALERTPDQLPILKQVGVVDAGGQGLVLIYEGFLTALVRGRDGWVELNAPISVSPDISVSPAQYHHSVQSQLSAEDIEYGYCTEFIIRMTPEGQAAFHEESFRDELAQFGDSMVVVSDDDLVKVHIHAEQPGEVMNKAQRYGELTRIKIENMREQHSHIVEDDRKGAVMATTMPAYSAEPVQPDVNKPLGIVAVAAGDGLCDVFHSVGVDFMLSGGQTMNPSTEDILDAVRSVAADIVFVLPNNSNIVLAAEQAKELSEKRIVVIPTKTIPQGLSAALAFRADVDADQNEASMRSAYQSVRSGSITYAVRDSSIGDLTIKEGDYLAMLDNEIILSGPDLEHIAQQLLDRMLADGEEIVTIFTGKDAEETSTESLLAYLEEHYPDVEAESHSGGQPVYYYLISVE